MNYIIDENIGVNRENYELLAIAIITQAIRDIENGLIMKKSLRGREPRSKSELNTIRLYEDAEKFFYSEWFEELAMKKDLEGKGLLKKLKENFFNYRRCIFTDEDWDKIRRGKTPRKKMRQTIYGG